MPTLKLNSIHCSASVRKIIQVHQSSLWNVVNLCLNIPTTQHATSADTRQSQWTSLHVLFSSTMEITKTISSFEIYDENDHNFLHLPPVPPNHPIARLLSVNSTPEIPLSSGEIKSSTITSNQSTDPIARRQGDSRRKVVDRMPRCLLSLWLVLLLCCAKL